MKFNWKLSFAIVLIAGGAIGVALNPWTRGHVVEVWRQLSHTGSHGDERGPDKSWLEPLSDPSKGPWNRILSLSDKEIRAIGLKTAVVKKQTEPTVLRLFGNTDYDPAYVTVVRTQFDSRVDKVLVDYGTIVKVDDPLLQLFSTDLAEAKSNYEASASASGPGTRKCSIISPTWPGRKTSRAKISSRPRTTRPRAASR